MDDVYQNQDWYIFVEGERNKGTFNGPAKELFSSTWYYSKVIDTINRGNPGLSLKYLMKNVTTNTRQPF